MASREPDLFYIRRPIRAPVRVHRFKPVQCFILFVTQSPDLCAAVYTIFVGVVLPVFAIASFVITTNVTDVGIVTVTVLGSEPG